MTDKPSAALLIARETLATRAESRGASHTANCYRSGAWDDSGEIHMATLVATAAIKATYLEVADACDVYASDQRAMISRRRTRRGKEDCYTRAEVYEGLSKQLREG